MHKIHFLFFEQTFYNDYKDKYNLIKGVIQGNHTIKAIEQIHNIPVHAIYFINVSIIKVGFKRVCFFFFLAINGLGRRLNPITP